MTGAYLSPFAGSNSDCPALHSRLNEGAIVRYGSVALVTNLPFPAFTDLRGLASNLDGQPAYRRLRSVIERAARTQSCVSDLTQAHLCCDALDELLPSPRKVGTLTRSATEAALLQTAVVLYERGTAAAPKQGERGSISIVEQLTPKQRLDHDALVLLRQRAIAHVYVGEAIEGEIWHRDLLFAVEMEGAWKAAAASNRVQFNRATFDRLKRQLPVAVALLTTRFHEHLNRLTAMLNDNPVSVELFQRHQFDPVEKFGGERAVRQLLAGRLSGKASLLS